jgi:hypothetical protein
MNPISSAGDAASGAMDLVRQVASALDDVQSLTGAKSLIDVSRHARVEPLMIVDPDLLGLDYLPDVAQTMQGLFAGYYLQAVDILANVDGVKVAEMLAPLNPNRKLDIGLLDYADDHKLRASSYQHRLPTNKRTAALEGFSDSKAEYITIRRDKVALEAAGKVDPKLAAAQAENAKLKEALNAANAKGSHSSLDAKDVTKLVSDLTPLSVGKLYDVTLRSGKETAVVKIAIRLLAKMVPTSSLIGIFAHNSVSDMDLKERFHGWRSGRLSFFRDLVLCQDLIESHRNNIIKDKTNTYKEILDRETDGWFAGLIEKNPSVAIASNLALISSDTLDQIQDKMLGSIENPKIRREIFNTSNLMILGVVDKGFDRITFYHRGIAQSTEMGVRDIKVSNKGGGPDVSDILKAFLGGHAPSL